MNIQQQQQPKHSKKIQASNEGGKIGKMRKIKTKNNFSKKNGFTGFCLFFFMNSIFFWKI